jgi:hypothetical protein
MIEALAFPRQDGASPDANEHIAGAKAVRDDGTRHEFDVGPGLVARIHVSFFASTLSVQLDVKNTGSTKVVHCTYRTRTETLCSDG